MCLICVFGRGFSLTISHWGFVARSKIQSWGSVTWLHCIGLGITTLDLVMSVCKSNVSPFLL